MYDFVSYIFMFMLLLAVVGVGIALYLIVSDIFFVVREWREMRAEKERHAEELRDFRASVASHELKLKSLDALDTLAAIEEVRTVHPIKELFNDIEDQRTRLVDNGPGRWPTVEDGPPSPPVEVPDAADFN